MPKSTSKLTKAELEMEVSRLRSKVAELEKPGKSVSGGSRKAWIKPLAAGLFVVLATVLLVVGNIFFWTGNTIVNTNRYVATVGPLIEKPEIQSAVSQYTTTQIFKNVDVEGYVQTALPPKLEFLAPQLTSQLKSKTQSTLNKILASQKAKNFWYQSLSRRHAALIKFSKTYQGNGTIKVSDVYSQLSQRLAGTKLSFLSNKQLPANVGSITIATAGWLPVLHKVSTHIGTWQLMATLLLIVFFGLAIALSRNRRTMVIRLALILAASMLLTLLAVRITRGIVVGKAADTYQPAVQVAYTTVMHSFVIQTLIIMLVLILATAIAWISGNYKSAGIVRGRFAILFSGKLHQSIFGTKENSLTRWISKYKAWLEWLYVGFVALVMLLVELSPKLILVYAILLLIGILVIEILSGYPQK